MHLKEIETIPISLERGQRMNERLLLLPFPPIRLNKFYLFIGDFKRECAESSKHLLS
jgi:hypothetical protein